MFKVGDRVFSPFHNYGTIVGIDETDRSYPITVQIENTKITKVEEEGKVGQIARVVHHNILREAREKRHAEGRKFKVGDRVFSFYYGFGVVERISDEVVDPYPVVVHWDQDKARAAELNTCNYYTMDGKYTVDDSEPDRDLFLMNEEEDESTVERMEDALSKKVDDAINPSHYNVEGLPEAIDIINHLMHREQYEGFLWGNILKYAYRFGRKGDKAETAGKIAWYANQLKDLEEEKHK